MSETTLSPQSQALAAKIKTLDDGTVVLPNGTPANRGPIGVEVRSAHKPKASANGTPAKAAKSAPSKNGKAKAAAKTAAGKDKAGTGPSHSAKAALILKKMSAKSGGTLQDVVKWTGLNDRAAYHHLWHLRKDGFVKSSTADEVGVVFELTAAGKKLAAKAA